jgi:hypothetical protein
MNRARATPAWHRSDRFEAGFILTTDDIDATHGRPQSF